MRLRYRYKGKDFFVPLDRECAVIGRGVSNATVDLDLWWDGEVSRQHARVWRDGDQYWLEDLDSRSGTFAGDIRLPPRQPRPLAPGAPFRVGATELALVAEVPAEPPDPDAGAGDAGGAGGGPPARRGLQVTAHCQPVFNYALTHVDFPFLDALSVHNAGPAAQAATELQLALDPYVRATKATVPALAPGAQAALEPLPQFQITTERLRDLKTADGVALRALVDGREVALDPAVFVDVLPPGAWTLVDPGQPVAHWQALAAALAAFVLPNAAPVHDIILRAGSHLRRLLPAAADPRLRHAATFHQVRERAPDLETTEALRLTLHALHDCLAELQLQYAAEPAHRYARGWQEIRFPDVMRQQGKGTCIDWALLWAACLENLRWDPLLVIVGGEAGDFHALVACRQPTHWAEQDAGPGAARPQVVLTSPDAVRRLIAAGDLVILEAVGAAIGLPPERTPTTSPGEAGAVVTGLTFEQAEAAGWRQLDQRGFCYAVDIVAARQAELAPLPFGQDWQYDPRARDVLDLAQAAAAALEHAQLSPRHLLLALLDLPGGLLAEYLRRCDPALPERAAAAVRGLPYQASAGGFTTFNWSRVLATARLLADHHPAGRGAPVIGEAELTQALLQTDSTALKALGQAGITAAQCLADLRADLGGLTGASVVSE